MRPILFLFFSLLSLNLVSLAGPRKVIIDTDPGTDDAMAIMLALNSPEFDVRALTVVPGNVTAAQSLENALRLVSLANRCDVAVAAGAQHPLFQKQVTAEFWHGKNGMGNVDLPPSKCKVDQRWAPDLIIEMIHANPNEITLVREVIVMGGGISGGNENAAAEFNIYNDPEAAQVVFQAGWPLTMVGLDVCNKTLLTREQMEALAKNPGPISKFIYQLADFLVTLNEKNGKPGSKMFDPLAVGVAIDSTLVHLQLMHVDVETRGEFTRGETVANRQGFVDREVLQHFPDGDHYVVDGIEQVTLNVKVATEVNSDKFLQMFITRIQGK
jgi:inosine-uridine nucleoside N-ribohydrolase